MGILEFFPDGLTPRAGQRDALETIEKRWDEADVFVVEAPTAFGKTHVVMTLARWLHKVQGKKSFIVTPTNVLRDQYKRDVPRLFSIKKRHEYTCIRSTPSCQINCQEWYDEHSQPCKGCPHTKALRQARVLPYQVNNTYAYMAHKLFMPVLIADEAHTLVQMRKELAARTLWWHDYHFPHYVRDYKGLLRWTKEKLVEFDGVDEHAATAVKQRKKRLELLHADLISGEHKFLVEKGVGLYRGVEKPCLKMLPINTSAEPPLLWPPGKVEKVFLFSATIGQKDIEQLGLADRRVCWIRGESPIPAAQRPFVSEASLNMSYSGGGKDLDQLASYVVRLMRRHEGEAGLIHITYSLMDALRLRLSSLLAAEHPAEWNRLLFHTRTNKQAQFDSFVSRTDGPVFLCAGLYEGVDLPDDLGRWQLITKVPWASLADPALKWLADSDPEQYQWDTLKLVMQAAGRVCRTPTDWGITYCSDRSVRRLPRELMPLWFGAALDAGEQLIKDGGLDEIQRLRKAHAK